MKQLSRQVSEPQMANAPVLQHIRQGLIGDGHTLQGPFGPRKLVYCDNVASGRALTHVEDYIRDQVLPLYGNTHTAASATGRQMSAFREEARATIAKSVNATADDAVIFTGAGSSAAIHLFVQALMKNHAGVRPLVLLGPYEHNSNRLMFREMADVICIKEAMSTGGPDLQQLESELSRSKHRLKIGSFSAASNVTGALTDTVAVTRVLKKFGALACFDYAAAAPYCAIDMNPEGAKKDAVFISTHKFVGGPGSPGLLIVKKNLMRTRTPVLPGGGTVLFVDEQSHAYVEDIEAREEGGTPDIIGSIRAGLAFSVKDMVGTNLIAKREHSISKHVMQKLTAHPKMLVLGSHENERLPTFSFMVKHHAAFLHYDFVSTLLNDLFGIQSRGGCACAGPYSLFLLGVPQKKGYNILEALIELRDDAEIAKPGFTRFNLPYFASDEMVEFVTDAVLFLAEHAWKFLPYYRFDSKAQAWVVRNSAAALPQPKKLADFSFSRSEPEEDTAASSPAECLELAYELMLSVQAAYPELHVPASEHRDLVERGICWFLRPQEVLDELRDPCVVAVRPDPIFLPVADQQEACAISKNFSRSWNPLKHAVRFATRIH